jgi:hypothetical protein
LFALLLRLVVRIGGEEGGVFNVVELSGGEVEVFDDVSVMRTVEKKRR